MSRARAIRWEGYISMPFMECSGGGDTSFIKRDVWNPSIHSKWPSVGPLRKKWYLATCSTTSKVSFNASSSLRVQVGMEVSSSRQTACCSVYLCCKFDSPYIYSGSRQYQAETRRQLHCSPGHKRIRLKPTSGISNERFQDTCRFWTSCSIFECFQII